MTSRLCSFGPKTSYVSSRRLDGYEVPDLALHTAVVQPSPPRDTVTVGASFFVPSAAVVAHQAWIDNVLVDDVHIGVIR